MGMLVDTLRHSLMITGFVLIMMLVIEYIHVQTRGGMEGKLAGSRWRQYLFGAILGAVPGCLGPFTVVALYAHRNVSFGALVASMIATSGDEAYVMLSLFPGTAIFIFLFLIPVGVISGWLADRVLSRLELDTLPQMHSLKLHKKEYCKCFNRGLIWPQLRQLSMRRGLLVGVLAVFLAALVAGGVGPQEWNWVRITFLISGSFGLFVALTVPEHFLEEHLWEHVVKRHLLRIFLWTFAALFLINILTLELDVRSWIQGNVLTVLIIAVLIGIIPESGPHLLFVTLYADGALPLGILLANSIVQDGHGTLPLLAVSTRSFFWLKVINILVGLVIGAGWLLIVGS